MMKKCLMAAAVAAVMVLSGCSLVPGQSSSSEPTPEQSAAPAAQPTAAPTTVPTASPTASPSAAPTPAVSAAVPDEAAVIGAYESLTEFQAFWYEGGNFSAAAGGEITENGVPYCKYETEQVKSFDDLKNLALTLVSEELFEEFQARFTYIDHDGVLYGPVGYGAGDNSGFVRNECEVVKISDTEFELKAGKYYKSEVLSEGEVTEKEMLVSEDTCRYSLVNGKWVFTSVASESKNSVAG